MQHSLAAPDDAGAVAPTARADVGSSATLRTISAFVHLSLDGFYSDHRGDMSFAYRSGNDAEWQEYVRANAGGGGALLLGRKTYELMAAWWPTPAAAQSMPEVAHSMNEMTKYVASRTLSSADWANTTLLNGSLTDSVRTLKREPGSPLTILGSGSIVAQLAGSGLLDALQVVVNPIALGAGKSLFSGVTEPVEVTLERVRSFRNGAVVLSYSFPGRNSA